MTSLAFADAVIVFDVLAVVFGMLGGLALLLLSIFDAFNHSNIHWPLTLVFIVRSTSVHPAPTDLLTGLHRPVGHLPDAGAGLLEGRPPGPEPPEAQCAHQDYCGWLRSGLRHVSASGRKFVHISTIYAAASAPCTPCAAVTPTRPAATASAVRLPFSSGPSRKPSLALVKRASRRRRFLFDIYLATFILDLWPAAKTSPRHQRRMEKHTVKEKGLLQPESPSMAAADSVRPSVDAPSHVFAGSRPFTPPPQAAYQSYPAQAARPHSQLYPAEPTYPSVAALPVREAYGQHTAV
jgi:hypothetical protein